MIDFPFIGKEEKIVMSHGIFDMFYRVKSTDMKAAGTGLGLAICRGLMEAHKGKIWAQTGISGQGTTIVISLPLSAVGGALSHIEESHE